MAIIDVSHQDSVGPLHLLEEERQSDCHGQKSAGRQDCRCHGHCSRIQVHSES